MTSYNYQELKHELKQRKYNLYILSKFDLDSPRLISGNFKSRSEIFTYLVSENELEEENIYIILKLGFHTGKNPLQGGPLCVTIVSYIYDKDENKCKNGFPYDALCRQVVGRVWFQQRFLEVYGWDDSYLSNMIVKLAKKKVELCPLVVNHYNVYFT